MSALRGALLAATALLVVACGSTERSQPGSPLPRALLREARPVGRGPRFQPSVSGRPVGTCRPALGTRYGSHVELFAANRVVIVPAGIGTFPPRQRLSGRIIAARCYGRLVTLEPTGLVLVATGAPPTLADLFRAWGQPLSRGRLGPFNGRVRVFVDGRLRSGSPRSVSLGRRAVIVLEVGPYVPPHTSYRFPPGT